MRVETEIKQWGNSLALRITGIMSEVPRLDVGTRVTVDVSSEGLVVKPVAGQTGVFRFPYSESALLAWITPDTAHADALADPAGIEVGIQMARGACVPQRRDMILCFLSRRWPRGLARAASGS